MNEQLRVHLKEAAELLKGVNHPIKIIGHFDSDGLSAVVVLMKALQREGKAFSVAIVERLDEKILQQLKKEPSRVFIFLDIGSGYLKVIEEHLQEKSVYVLDHHAIERLDSPQKQERFQHLNPREYGYDGSLDVSGAGMAYFFAKALNENNCDLAPFALVGMRGDQQRFLSELQKETLQDAFTTQTIYEDTEPELFPSQNVPVDKLLEFSPETLFIPEVTANTIGTIDFLTSLGIKRAGTLWPKYGELTTQQREILLKGIIEKRGLHETKEQLLKKYIHCTVIESQANTLDEVAEVLDACGRLKRYHLALGFCLNNKNAQQGASECLSEYRKKLAQIVQWFQQEKKSPSIRWGEGYVIMNATTHLEEELTGRVATMFAHPLFVHENSFVVILARSQEGKTKVSLRYCGALPLEVDLDVIIKSIALQVGGRGGGHKHRAGAVIETKNEESFIAAIEVILKKKSMEELI